MNPHIGRFWDAVYHMVDSFVVRLPSLIIAIIVFLLFYLLSLVLSRLIVRATRGERQNVGIVLARLAGASIILVGLLVAFSVVAPSFQAADLIKILGIGGVAIGFAFQNILQNFLAGLLLLWTQPFRVGDQIKIDNYEGTVEEIQTRATVIQTYDERTVIIPNADLFTHSVTVNTTFQNRRWEYVLTVRAVRDLTEFKSGIVNAVKSVPGVLSEPSPEVLIMELSNPESATLKMRVLWWTKALREHQMLASYDQVLFAISKVLDNLPRQQDRPQDQAA